MEVQPKNPTAKGPVDWFTGDVWIDAVAQGHGPSPVSIGSVHFAPGAAPDHFMTHLSMSEGDAEWGEHVGDSEYRGQG
jgi:hypothetical protein